MYWLPVILILPYFVLFLGIYRNLLKLIPFHASSAPSTFVSVIIACRNEQEKLPALLDCLSRQNYPKELFEVIIVDDNSTDRTFETASENRGLGNVSVLKNNVYGKKEAIKTGIIASSGRLIITTDADCTPGTGWIKTIASFFEQNNPDLIICPVKLDGIRGFFGKFQELEYLSLQGITAGTAIADKGIMCNGANLAFTRESYLEQMDKLHFGLPTGDDVFLLHSLKKKINSRIMWLESNDSVVSTAPSSDLRSFLRQRKRWISKWNTYSDRFTILTAILVFVATLLQLSVFVSLIVDISFLWLFLAVFILKSVPDYLILRNTTERYGKMNLMRWFLPAQMIYPLYVLGVVLFSLIPAAGRAD
jgi:poly-beta-1,6-N-acetyl-D-glucosamine synthase